ncbi:hypothetical protein [Candidatus Chlorohelix sp.]|uniref:hypothetical protein n=1 Tax=Candidatus Chlorohelix sp. TaxID=3139201 RepID=UPI0030712A34
MGSGGAISRSSQDCHQSYENCATERGRAEPRPYQSESSEPERGIRIKTFFVLGNALLATALELQSA